MGVPYEVTSPIPFSGLDQRGNKRSRPPSLAEYLSNLEPLGKSDDHLPRRGFRLVAHGNLGYNLALRGSEILSLGPALYRLKQGTLTITKTTAGSDHKLSSTVQSSNPFEWVIDLQGVNDISVTGFPKVITPAGYSDLGSSCPSVEDIRALIDALADFTATVSGEGTTTAICLPILFRYVFIQNEPLVLPFYYVEQVLKPTPMTASAPYVVNDRTTPVLVAVELAGNTYFPLPNDDVIGKYDGVDWYAAGMPKPAAPTVSAVGSGSVGTGSWPDVYSHFLVYAQYDASGNVITGERSDEDTTSISALSNFSISVPNIVAATKYNTASAIVNGAQAGVTTITVDSGHTLQVGHTAYFLDGVSGDYVEREITAIAATTITIAGANVNVADNAVISNNLRIQVWRTAADGTVHKLVAEIPNDSFNATQTYVDSVVDASLGASYDYPEREGKEHGKPPGNVSALAVFSNEGDGDLLIALKGRDAYFSDLDGPEAFPAQHVFQVAPGGSDLIGGVQCGNELLLFQRYATWKVFGDLVAGEFRLLQESNVYGCAANATIKKYQDSVIWCGTHSVYQKQAGGPIEDIGAPIWDFFYHRGINLETKLVVEKAVAEIDAPNDRYLLHLPALQGAGDGMEVDWYSHRTNSVTFAYYFQRRQWYLFRGVQMGGGVIALNGEIIFNDPYIDGPGEIVPVFALNRSDMRFDYFDWDAVNGIGTAVSYEYRSGWVHADLPASEKKFLRVGIFSDNGGFLDASQLLSDFSVSATLEANFKRGTTHTGPVTLTFSATEGLLQFFEAATGPIRAVSLKLTGTVFNKFAVLSNWVLEMANNYLPKVRK